MCRAPRAREVEVPPSPPCWSILEVLKCSVTPVSPLKASFIALKNGRRALPILEMKRPTQYTTDKLRISLRVWRTYVFDGLTFSSCGAFGSPHLFRGHEETCASLGLAGCQTRISPAEPQVHSGAAFEGLLLVS